MSPFQSIPKAKAGRTQVVDSVCDRMVQLLGAQWTRALRSAVRVVRVGTREVKASDLVSEKNPASYSHVVQYKADSGQTDRMVVVLPDDFLGRLISVKMGGGLDQPRLRVVGKSHTAIDLRLIKPFIDEFAETMSRVCQGFDRCHVTAMRYEPNFVLMQEVLQDSTVMVVDFRADWESGVTDTWSMVLPRRLIDRWAQRAEKVPQYLSQDVDLAERAETIADHILDTEVHVTAALGYAEMNLRDILALSVGQTFALSRDSQPILKIEGKDKLRGEATTLKGQRAFRIIRSSGEPDGDH